MTEMEAAIDADGTRPRRVDGTPKAQLLFLFFTRGILCIHEGVRIFDVGAKPRMEGFWTLGNGRIFTRLVSLWVVAN